jgi:hypothetical protein
VVAKMVASVREQGIETSYSAYVEKYFKKLQNS